ncbi:MAG: pilus assembly protein PilM [Oscillospiraceae bacterium]|nr:pilus assembly protein PilM [Oscillospiraceae bacterium]
MAEIRKEQENNIIFALDIGTRSIIGVVGVVEGRRLHVLAIEKQDHGQRAMLDGQIENIEQVAEVAREVIARLEKRTKIHLTRVCVAAAGRALKSESASFTLELGSLQMITEDVVNQLEAGAVSEAEHTLREQSGMQSEQYYMVGYTVSTYKLDGYPMSSIRDHSGRVLEAEVVVTFLPREVVESLYAVVGKVGLEVASLTLEPIASLNAAIPNDIRLLNLVLVDIGAGTSDIAICRDGSVVGYTMATIAGDEITELMMRALLVEFSQAEKLKMQMGEKGKIAYTDILGIQHETTSEELREMVAPAVTALAQELAKRILEINDKVPSAVFLAGGGSKLCGLRERVAEELKIEPARVAIAGNHFEKNAFADDYDLNDPEYATPLGIAISAGLGLINDSYVILLNGQPAKLFRSGVLIMRDILMMNGYRYADLIGRTGANLSFMLNGERQFFRGALATPAVILLNGEPAELTDVVHAGDAIQFIPARQGADAAKTIADFVGKDYSGVATINGASAPLDQPIHAGDDVWIDGLGSYSGARRAEADENETEEFKAPAPAQTERPAAAERKETPAPAQNDGASAAALSITLNDMPVLLPAKPNNEPYYLMDMLEFSGIDFDHIDKPVELMVNGIPGQFSQILFNNDVIVIR